MSSQRVRKSAEDRRTELVKRAERLIASSGFHSFSIAALAADAAMTRQGVLHHVGSKEQLLLDVLHERQRQATDETSRLIDAVGRYDAREVLDSLVRRHLDEPELTRFFAILGIESLDPAHPAHGYFVERLTRGARSFAPLFEDSFADPEGIAKEILMVIDGLELNWLRDSSIDLWASWTRYADARLGHRPYRPT